MKLLDLFPSFGRGSILGTGGGGGGLGSNWITFSNWELEEGELSGIENDMGPDADTRLSVGAFRLIYGKKYQ